MVDVCGVRISTKMEVESYESGDGCGGCLVIVVMTVVVTFQINSTPQASTPTPTTTHLRNHPQGPTEGGGGRTHPAFSSHALPTADPPSLPPSGTPHSTPRHPKFGLPRFLCVAAERLRRVLASCCGRCGGERPGTGWRVSLGETWLVDVCPENVKGRRKGGSEGDGEGAGWRCL